MLLMQRTLPAFVRPDRADARPDFLPALSLPVALPW